MKTTKEVHSTIVPDELTRQFGYTNQMAVPKIAKVVLNVGAGRAKEQSNLLDEVTKTLTTISGQKPVITKAKRALASFKIRQGQPIGVKVTLRGKRMFAFLDRLINVALPRIRDFRGIQMSIADEHGNIHLGLRDQTIFPEIQYENIGLTHGLEVSIVTSAKSQAEAVALLGLLGFPWVKPPQSASKE